MLGDLALKPTGGAGCIALSFSSPGEPAVEFASVGLAGELQKPLATMAQKKWVHEVHAPLFRVTTPFFKGHGDSWATARKPAAFQETLILDDSDAETPKALQASECSELLDPMRFDGPCSKMCWFFWQMNGKWVPRFPRESDGIKY